MNDNDIRKLIDNCTDQIGETGVNADEVKQLVMAKIGAENKNTAIEDTENDVYAEPVFVSKSSGGNLKFKIAFTAAAAAACVGIAAVGFNFVRGGISGDLLNGGSGKDAILNGTADGEDISLIDTEKGEDISLLGHHTGAAAQSEDILHVTLLNGIERTYDFNGNSATSENNITGILALGDNELWFIGNGEKINVTKAAGDKSYYIYTYVNQNTKREHKVIVSNTTEPAECGYFELYRIDDIEGYEKACGWQTDGRNCYINSDMTSAIAEGYKQWVYDALEELGLTAFDRKASERVDNGEVIDMNNAVYITGSPLPIFTDYVSEEFKLLNGGTIKIDYFGNDNHSSVIDPGTNINAIFAAENGRIYFTGNQEHLDITDEVSNGKVYIYPYINPDRDRLHYIVAGGTAKHFGYTEIFPTDNDPITGDLRWATWGIGLGTTLTDPLMISAVEQLNISSILFETYNEKALDLTVDASGCKDKFMPSYSGPIPEGYDIVEEITLLNGDKVRLIRSGDDPYNALEYHLTTNDFPIFSLENGRIFFDGNNENIDITNAVSDTSAYTYFYTHPDRNKTHCLVACGTADSFEYAEVYPMDEDENGNLRWNTWAVITPEADYDFLESAVEGLLIDGSVTGISEVMVDAILKNTDEENDASYSYQEKASVDPLPAGETLVEEFNLLDNTLVRRAVKDDNQQSHSTYMYSVDNIDIFSSEDGRLYFIGNGEHADITDIISEDKTYVYYYIHPERNTVHYIIAGGGADDFGYAELFTVYEARPSGCLHGYNCFNERNESDEFSAYKPWLSNAIEGLDIFTPAGGGGEKDFSYLFGSGS